MDPEVGKITAEVTEKVLETVAPTLIQKVLKWRPAKKSAEVKTRDVKNRGEWARRSGAKDRRVSSMSKRLITGFRLEYCRRTGAGDVNILARTRETREDLYSALVTEAARYHFTDRTSRSILEPAVVIETAFDVTWATWRHRPKNQSLAIVFFEELTEYLMLKYNVNNIDRRKQQRRQVLPIAANGADR